MGRNSFCPFGWSLSPGVCLISHSTGKATLLSSKAGVTPLCMGKLRHRERKQLGRAGDLGQRQLEVPQLCLGLLCSSLSCAASLPAWLKANLAGKETSGGTDGNKIVLGYQCAGGSGKKLDRCCKKDHMNLNFLSFLSGLVRMLVDYRNHYGKW